NYLEKENHMQMEKGKGLEQENWFNGTGNEIRRQEVRMKIDGNIAKLGRSDSKFFLINISPSQKELAFLYEKYGKEGAKEKLKDFAVKVMDEYAKNFKRTGVNSHIDLLWYGKHENYRYYKHTDKEVKEGSRQNGERKDGRQDHIQIIVSRKDITNKIKLSPQNTSKGKNKEHSEKLGEFNRTAFKQSGEILFDNIFGFDRGLKETIAYSNTMKNGTAEQKIQMQTLDNTKNHQGKSDQIIIELARGVAEVRFESVGQMFSTTSKFATDLLSILLEPVYISPQVDPIDESNRRRRKKNKIEQSRGRGM
ncbi:MAG: molybdopterin-guanine dinucleotide biosynthesis protein MobB, partial [Chitinophagaceae bacterium]